MPLRYLVALIALSAAQAVTIGQTDTFTGGDLAGWHIGNQTPVPIPAGALPSVQTGGPGGAADEYLELNALGGDGPGSRLSVMSGPQWAGNYLDAGIWGIQMSVRNFGPENLYLRLIFEDFPAVPGPPTNLALSKDAVLVQAGGDWTTVVFPVHPAAPIPGVFGTVNGALANADVVRLFHNPVAAFPGPGGGQPSVTATLGVDNITAVVPEPVSTSLVAAGLVMLAIRRRMTP